MNMTDLREGEKVAFKSIIYLILLGLAKTAAGIITGMTVVIADAISTFADILGLFASYLGLKLSRRTADKKFEYGYYKIETFAALIVSIGIIYLGYKIFINSINTFSNPQAGQFRLFAITITIVAIVHSFRLEKRLMKAGKKVNSLSLIANAKDKKMDVYAGLGVLISIIANYRGIPYVEGIVSGIIAFVIFKEGVISTKESLFFLLDYWDDPKLSRKIKAVLSEEKDLVLKVKQLKLRRAGTFIFGQAYIDINPYAGIEDLREELEDLQKKVEDIDPYIKSFSILTHIPKSKNALIAVPIKSGRSLSSEVAQNLKSTKGYLFARIKKGKIQNFYIKKIAKDQKNPTSLVNFFTKEKVNIIIDNNLNSLLYYNLRRIHHILIYPNFSDIKKAGDKIKLLLIDT